MVYEFTDIKKVIKNGLAKGTHYKVLCDGTFYAWLKRHEYNFKENRPKLLEERWSEYKKGKEE